MPLNMGYAQVAFRNHRFAAFTSSDNYSAVLDMTPPTTTTPVTLPHTGTHPQALLELGGAVCGGSAGARRPPKERSTLKNVTSQRDLDEVTLTMRRGVTSSDDPEVARNSPATTARSQIAPP